MWKASSEKSERMNVTHASPRVSTRHYDAAASPTGALAIDPEFGEVVRGLVMNAYAEFDVRLLGANGAGEPHTLQFNKDKITLRRGGREGAVLLREAYRTDFKVVLSAARMNTLVVQLGEGEALPLAVDAIHERDLIALVARSFWALAVKAGYSSESIRPTCLSRVKNF